MESAAHILVSGVVQGVGYRYFVLMRGRKMGLRGYVRNLYRGEVELEVEGEKALILEFVKEIRVGPPSAHVTDIQVKWHEPQGKFVDFQVHF
ncbi:MAG: acylphosphatase [candidate division Zixibacteria bacterium SM23_81]|nr:MAG: acylphosphatase [candidate division Zixibacteria bacterium SM23_81]